MRGKRKSREENTREMESQCIVRAERRRKKDRDCKREAGERECVCGCVG